MKIYTRTGDAGETSLLGGQRVRKDELRIEVIGSIDETNAVLGVVRVELLRSGVAPEGIDGLLSNVQHALFEMGAELASRSADAVQAVGLEEADVAELETAIDRCESVLEPLTSFILPGGAAAAAQLHVARCVCRRAERRLVELAALEPVRSELGSYVNRLGDLLFVLARLVNKQNRVPDVAWRQKQTDEN
jgi:cob(I)alamin adenosyltransferase